MKLSFHKKTGGLLGAAALFLSAALGAVPAIAQDGTGLSEYAATGEPPLFDNAAAAADALKAALAKDDFDAVATLLGLDAAKLKSSEGVMDSYAKIRDGATKALRVQEVDGKSIVQIGTELWPLPFPIIKGSDGKWAFDTNAGLEEILNRRVGENEIETIATMRAYVDAQQDYAAADRDGDGVLEFAQKLISSEGQADGLYWPPSDTLGVSPAGDFISQAALDKAKEGNGYFGYRYRILTKQGNNIAGGAYDYVINGNMIAGYGLVAWPVSYAETGVHTFVVNNRGIIYEADLGADTGKIAASIQTFNPNDGWKVSDD